MKDALKYALIGLFLGLAWILVYCVSRKTIRTKDEMHRLYPNVPLNLKVGEFEGVNAACSSTVNGGLAQTPTNVLAIMGDFSLIKWGMVRDMMAEIIEFGDPDGQGDLKRYNQVAYRTEAVLGYAVVNPAAFSVLYAGAEPDYS